MAEVTYTGSNSAGPFSFSFASYQVSDVKVSVDGVDKTVNTHYTISNYTTTGGGQVTFTTGNVPTSAQQIRIYRSTDISSIKASFAAGSSIKSEDLNNNFNQLLLSSNEHIRNVEEDTAPKLGADLDLNGKYLDGILNVKRSNSNIQPEIRFLCTHHDDSGSDSHDGYRHYAAIKAPSGSDFNSNYHLVFQLPHNSGSTNQVLTASNVSSDQVIVNGVTSTRYTTKLGWTSITAASGSGIASLSDDTSPQLGGRLDMLSYSIYAANGILGVKNGGTASELQLYCETNNVHYVGLKAPSHSGLISGGSITFTLPDADGTANQVLKTDGNGNLGWVSQSSGGGGGLIRAQATAISLIFS